MSKIKNTLINSLAFAFLVLSLLTLFAWFHTNYLWGNVYFEQILFHLGNGTTEAIQNIIRGYVILCVVPAVALSLLLAYLIDKNRYLIFISVLSLAFCAYKIQIIPFLINHNTYTSLYEEEYYAPEDIDFQFPQQKRNIIILYMESMEKDYADPQLVGTNLLLNLSHLAAENISFDGYHQLLNQDYTIAGMVASFCAVPLRLVLKNDYTTYNNFLRDLVCYPQILKKNGYKTYFMKGADLNFTRTGMFFETHGFDDVKGELELKSIYNLARPEYLGTSWGLKDSTLYDIAKQRLTEISKQKEPFLFTMLTLDTHGRNDTYLDKQCLSHFKDNRDVVVCADKMAADFIDWIKQQDFYPNTTVVILGDHIKTGKNDLYPQHQKRNIINIILNPAQNLPAAKSYAWTLLDIAPTILEAAGIKIPGGKFGLGRSLFSETPPLQESMGKNLDIELMKTSKRYMDFNKIKFVSEPLYKDYPAWGHEINTISAIKDYAVFSEAVLDIAWLDTLSMTLPDSNYDDITFDIQFRILFMSERSRMVKIYVNKQEIATWNFKDNIMQPIHKTLKIPHSLIEKNRRLLIEFRNDGLGYTPIGIGLGVQKFVLTKD